MNWLISLLSLVGFSTIACGQGQFVFNNRIGGEVDAPFYVGFCEAYFAASSPEWRILLLGGPAGTPVSQLVPLHPGETTFRGRAGSALAGYVVPITPAVPGVAAGGTADVLIRLLGPNGYIQDYGPYPISGLGGGTTLPPNLQLGLSPILPICIPEPSTAALGSLAICGFVVFVNRRRTRRLSRSQGLTQRQISPLNGSALLLRYNSCQVRLQKAWV